jgi:hypothetical protein
MPEAETRSTIHPEENSSAEQIPVTTEGRIPNIPKFIVLDTLTATAALNSNVIDLENSTDYQQILENLQRELKYKAFRKGASAILNFKIQLNLVSSPRHYRILATGLAIRPASTEPPSS